MIPTPSTHPRLSAVSPSGNISHRLSTLPATVSPQIRPFESRSTLLEFQDATGLSRLAMDKFLELGFVKPFGVWENGQKEIYCSLEDLKKVRVMITLLDGTLDLRQAHKKAEEMVTGKTPVLEDKVRKALQLSPRENRIERPYEMPRNWKKPQNSNSDSDTAQEFDGQPKPHRVNLCVTFADGMHQSEELTGRDVPRHTDWEDRADRLWLESDWSKHGPAVRIRMEDESGQQYLGELVYPLPKSDDETRTGKKGSLKLLRRWLGQSGTQMSIQKKKPSKKIAPRNSAGSPDATDQKTRTFKVKDRRLVQWNKWDTEY